MKSSALSFAWRRLRAAEHSAVRLRSNVLSRARAFWAVPPPDPLIEFVAADIVNNCNLRCPFCLVDYDNVRHTQLMDEPTSRALLRLAPAVPEAGFWLSCLHEPTLHPRLAEYLSWIPVDQRRKFWFTTNLARALPDELIASLARSGLHHINVSLDTFDGDLFSVLRRHGRIAVFRRNLECLIEQCRRTPGAPALRYITMAFRSNQHEIPDLVRWMNESGLAREIEIRYTYNTANIAEDFRREHFLRPADWDALRASLAALPYDSYVLSVPDPDYETVDPQPPANWFETNQGTAGERATAINPPLKAPLRLRARPDGRLHLAGQEHLLAVNVATLQDPIGYFGELCSATVST